MEIEWEESDPDYDREFVRALMRRNNPTWTDEQIDMELIRLMGCENELG